MSSINNDRRHHLCGYEMSCSPVWLFPWISRRIFRSSPWDDESECWKSLPKDLTKIRMVNWLNYVVWHLRQTFRIFDSKGTIKEPYFDQSWDCKTANSGPTRGSQYRKSDIFLLACRTCTALAGERPGWPLIQAFAEATKSQRTFKDIIRNIIEKAYLMFESQPF